MNRIFQPSNSNDDANDYLRVDFELFDDNGALLDEIWELADFYGNKEINKDDFPEFFD